MIHLSHYLLMERQSREEKRLADEVFLMPQEPEMAALLHQITMNPEIDEGFFPTLLKVSGKEISGSELTDIIVSATEEYIKTMPMPEISRVPMFNQVPVYLKVLITDGAIREDTLRLWQEKIEELKQKDGPIQPVSYRRGKPKKKPNKNPPPGKLKKLWLNQKINGHPKREKE